MGDKTLAFEGDKQLAHRADGDTESTRNRLGVLLADMFQAFEDRAPRRCQGIEADR
jgi:hypothetical protein